MSRREAKTAMYEQFARAGKGLANPKRLELLDLLAQGERSVESLATAAGLGTSTASMHLQALKDSGLVRARRQGTFIHYRLAGEDVAALFAAAAHRRHRASGRRRTRDRGLPRQPPGGHRRRRARRAHATGTCRRRRRPGRAPDRGVRGRAHPRRGLGPPGGARATPRVPARRRGDRRLLPRRVLRAGLRRRAASSPRPGGAPDACTRACSSGAWPGSPSTAASPDPSHPDPPPTPNQQRNP